MTLTLDGVRRRACNDCGRKWAVEVGKAGSDIGVSVGGELLSYHPSKELIAEVREKAKSGRLMCAYCSHRIAEADLTGFRIYIPRDMKSRHTYTLCPACEAKVFAGDKQILESVEEKIESGKYELGEEAGDYELLGEQISGDPLAREMKEEWAIYVIHENGETSVRQRDDMVLPQTYEECQKFIADYKPGTLLRHPGCGAVPRSEYDPRKHDTYDLRLGSKIQEAKNSVWSAGKRWGLLVDKSNVSSALDVMTRIQEAISNNPKHLGAVKSGRFLASAHPFVWMPDMVSAADTAARQLSEEVPATKDLLPLNPSIWLGCEPALVLNTAEKALAPATDDGHIPWPDEDVVDLGRFQFAVILGLDDKEFTHCHLVLELRGKIGRYVSDFAPEGDWRLRFYEYSFQVGSTPHIPDEQDILKRLLFLQSPYLVWRGERPQRSFVRRAEGQFPTAEKRINVVLLRHAVELQKGKHEAHGPVPWSCQWWVSSFWRRQWHPSTKTHKPTWIAPYIKGPPDKDAIRLIVR